MVDSRIPGRTSPYRVEGNPWVLDDDVERALLARGAYLSAVGQLETERTELALRLSKIDAYYQIRTSFPKRRGQRMQYLRDASDATGPLQKHGSALRKFVSRFETMLNLRDILAHGRMRALSGPGAGNVSLTFCDYYAVGGGAEYREERMTLGQLETRAKRACALSRLYMKLLSEVDDELPDLEYRAR